MAIELDYPTSRYTTTQTQSFRRAPMGEFGEPIDDFDKAWGTLANDGFFKLVGVSKALTDQFGALYSIYEKWRDAQTNLIGVQVPAAQSANFAAAQKIYGAAVAAGAKPEGPQKSGPVRTISTTEASKGGLPAVITGSTGRIFLVLGAALALLLWEPWEQPRRQQVFAGLGRRRRSLGDLNGMWEIRKKETVRKGPAYVVYHGPSNLPASHVLTHSKAREIVKALDERFPNLDPSDSGTLREAGQLIDSMGGFKSRW